MSGIDLLGFTAAFCTTFSFLPQAVRVIRTRDTRSLSLSMYSIFTGGVALWLVYGVLKQDWAVAAANLVTLALAAVILYNKLRNDVFGRSPPAKGDCAQP